MTRRGGSSSERRKVLFITAWYPTGTSPAGGNFVRDQAELVAQRHDVRVLHLAFGDRFRDTSPADPPVLRQRVLVTREPFGRVTPMLFFVVALVRFMVRERFVPDVVHGHVHQVASQCWLASKLFRCSWVQSEHSSGFEEGTVSDGDLRVARWAYPRADLVLPVSEHLRSTLESAGIGARYRVVWNAVDTDLFSPPSAEREPGPVRFLFVGWLAIDDMKNIVGLLEALVNRPDPEWQLTILGDGPAREDRQLLAGRLGVADRVDFRGAVDRETVAAEMRRHDVLVHPTKVETFSLAVAEALCTGMSVLASRTGAIPEMVHQTMGGVVVDDDGHLRAALVAAAPVSHEERLAVAARAQTLLSPSRLAEELEAAYAAVS